MHSFRDSPPLLQIHLPPILLCRCSPCQTQPARVLPLSAMLGFCEVSHYARVITSDPPTVHPYTIPGMLVSSLNSLPPQLRDFDSNGFRGGGASFSLRHANCSAVRRTTHGATVANKRGNEVRSSKPSFCIVIPAAVLGPRHRRRIASRSETFSGSGSPRA